MLEHATLRPGFPEFVERARDRSWRVVVLSSGFRELIEPVLEREGLGDLELLANAVEPDPRGLAGAASATSCRARSAASRASARTVVAEANGGPRVYIGDGISDRCGARASDLVFARRGLAVYLADEEVPYEPFEDFFHVASELDRRLSP